MPNDTKPSAPRKKRLPQVYYNIGTHLRRFLFTEGHINADTKRTAKELIDRLVVLSGVTPQEFGADVSQGWPKECALKDAARVYYFDMTEGDPRREEWSRLFGALRDMATLAAELRLARLKADDPAPQTVAEKSGPLKQTHTILKAGDYCWDDYGIPPNSRVDFEEVRDPRPGDLGAVLKLPNEKHWTAFGRVIRVAEGSVTIDAVRGIKTFETQQFSFYRVTSFRATVDRPEPGAFTEGEAEEREHRAKLDKLRERLERLSEGDDITDCSARLSLEKQIYDLEHPPKLDDWSAWEEKAEAEGTA